MKLALISLSKDDPEGGGPIGLLPLFDSMVVDRQVRTATRMGAERIVFLCPTIPGAILQYIDRLKRENIDAEIVRTARELVQYSSDDDQLLIFGDGILPSDDIEADLIEQSDETIYVVANADIFEDFERIDLNQRWIGVAQLRASRLSMMIDIPDDWNVSSALLRIAVQSECRRAMIPDPDMVAGAVVHLENSSETAEYTRRKLKKPGLAKGGLLERYAIWPITRRILPRLWQMPNVRLYMRAAGVVGSIGAVISAYFQLSVPALGLALLSGMLITVCRQMDVFAETSLRYFSDIPTRLNPLEALANLLSNGVLIILMINLSNPLAIVPNLTIIILYWLISMAVAILPDPASLKFIRIGGLLSWVILILAAAFGYFVAGIYAVTLWTALYLWLTSVLVARDIKSEQIS